MSEERLCIVCGQSIKGRADKKFCCDSCRNTYNNLQRASNKEIRNINNILKKNRQILQTLLPEKEKTKNIHRDILLKNGFQFKYHTHSYNTQKGDIYYYCYDHGYLQLPNDRYLLVRNVEQEANYKG